MRDEFLLWETVCLPAFFCQSGRHYYYYFFKLKKKYRARHYVACDIDFKMALWCLTAAQCGADACSLGDSEREEGKKKQDSCPIVVSGQFEPRLQLLPRAAPTIETAIYWRVADDNAAINLGARATWRPPPWIKAARARWKSELPVVRFHLSAERNAQA